MSQASLETHAQGLVQARENIRAAALMLQPGYAPLSSTEYRLNRRLCSRDCAIFAELTKGSMAAYSVEEVRRFLAPERPHLASKAWVDNLIRPHLKLNRPIDRFGEEPHLLVAAHLAHFLLGAPLGQSEAEAIEAFIARSPGVRKVWPEFSQGDVDRLRRIYLFVPQWECETKGPADLTLHPSCGNSLDHETRLFLWSALGAISDLAQIPLTDPTIETVNELRQEEGVLGRTRYIDVSHAFADKIPMLQSLIAYDGLHGEDIHILVKHYTGDDRTGRLIDVMKRVFGVMVERVEGDVEERAKGVFLSAVSESAGDVNSHTRPLIVHAAGVHFWHWVDTVQRDYPEVPIAAVSHTTSDGNDLLRPAGRLRYPIELMSLSEPKRIEESERFSHTLRVFIDKLAIALDRSTVRETYSPLFDRRFIIVGYGRIMGRAMATALKRVTNDYAVTDVSEEARIAASENHPVINSLEGEYDRELVVIGCANGLAINPTQLARIEKPAIFVQVQTGDEAFPMEWVRGVSMTNGRHGSFLDRQITGWLGDQPLVEYTLRPTDKTIRHLFAADGFVSNLAFMSPEVTAYSSFTNMLILESIRQTMWRLRRVMLGHKEEKGAHPLETIQIQMTPRKKRRVITILDRSAKDVSLGPVEEAIANDSDLANFVRMEKDRGTFFRSYLTQHAPNEG